MRRSNTLLLVLTILLCFAIGFGIGAFPDRWQRLMGRPPEHLTLLVSDPNILPAEFLLDFEKTTGTTVQLKVVQTYHLFRTEAQTSDLLLAPLAWLGNFPEILKELPKQSQLRTLLSSDFQTLQLGLRFFLPVLWSTEQRDQQTHLLIWGFASPNPSHPGVLEFLNFLLTSDRRQKEWALRTHLNSTLESSNKIAGFPEDQRARKIRDISLPNLVIDQKQ